MPYALGPEASANARAFQAWLEGVEKWDLGSIMAAFDDTLVQQVLPASLGRPAMSKKEYEAYFGGVIQLFADFEVS